MMNKLIRAVVKIFSPKEDDDYIAVKPVDGILRHMEVPDEVIGIVGWHNLFYETSTRSALVMNCLEKLEALSKTNHWGYAARKYITTHEWITIINASDFEEAFVEKVNQITYQFLS